MNPIRSRFLSTVCFLKNESQQVVSSYGFTFITVCSRSEMFALTYLLEYILIVLSPYPDCRYCQTLCLFYSYMKFMKDRILTSGISYSPALTLSITSCGGIPSTRQPTDWAVPEINRK